MFTYVTSEIFLFNLFLLIEMKNYKNKIITCTILIAMLLRDIGLKNIFFLPPQSVDVLSRFIYTALWSNKSRE